MEAKEACIHHWMLERPNGKLTQGTCKLCGMEREHQNLPDDLRELGHPWMRGRENLWTAKQRKAKMLRDAKAVKT